MFACRHEGARTELQVEEAAVARVYKAQGWQVTPDPDEAEKPKEKAAPEKKAEEESAKKRR